MINLFLNLVLIGFIFVHLNLSETNFLTMSKTYIYAKIVELAVKYVT
jgi:hypothetical protein